MYLIMILIIPGCYYTMNKYLTIRGTLKSEMDAGAVLGNLTRAMTSNAKENFVNGFNKLGKAMFIYCFTYAYIGVLNMIQQFYSNVFRGNT